MLAWYYGMTRPRALAVGAGVGFALGLMLGVSSTMVLIRHALGLDTAP